MSAAAGVAPASAVGDLCGRLLAVRPVLVPGPAPEAGDPGQLASLVLDELVRAVQHDLRPDRLWALWTAVAGSYPVSDLLEEGLRTFELETAVECTVWLMHSAFEAISEAGCARSLEVVTGVVVDVDHTARNDLHTGVQQVIRRTLPHWAGTRPLTLVAWARGTTGLRRLDGTERGRVLSFGLPAESVPGESVPDGALAAGAEERRDILLPWRSVLVCPDVASTEQLARLACLARFSGNSVVGVGYDCIPVISPQLVPAGSADPFVRYLSLVKHMRRIAAISASAAEEFGGFVDALPTQGLAGPVVVVCGLGADPPGPARHDAPAVDEPTILQVGSVEPRKNHLATLFAAELLWREGLRFRLSLIGGMAWGTEVPRRIEELRGAGRPIELRRGISHQELERAYSEASFTVFPSLHEGYGLPVVESLAAGTPVITSNFGATAECAAGGGVVLVDPRDESSLVAAVRRLLTDPVELSRLSQEAAHRPVRPWSAYAQELWAAIVEPELDALRLGATG